MQNQSENIIELVDDGTGTFVPSGKVERRKRRKKPDDQPATEQQTQEQFAMPPAFMEQMAPLMERQNFRGAHSPLDQLMDGMEIGTRVVNRFISIMMQLEKGAKVKR